MEGYFPIYKYSELTGISKDTAYHRAERGTVPSFKDMHGRWFLYFCDEERFVVPEGFISIPVYARMNNLKENTVRTHILKGHFNDEDIKIIKYMSKRGREFKYILINKNAEYFKLEPNEVSYRKMDECRPMGYLTVKEWAEREKIEHKYIVYGFIKNKIIPACKNFGHWYIHKSVKCPEKEENEYYYKKEAKTS